MKPKEIIETKKLTNLVTTKKKLCGIYMIYCISNEKAYVGQSRHICDRIRQHKNSLNKRQHENGYLQNIYDKYGAASLVYLVVELCEGEILLERETHYYNLLDSELRLNLREPSYCPPMDPEIVKNCTEKRRGRKMSEEDKQHLSNVMRGRVISDETRKKMSETWKKKIKDNPSILEQRLKHITNLAQKRRGTKLSKETCKKIGDAGRGRKILQTKTQYLSTEKVKEIKLLLLKGELNQTEIGRLFGISYQSIGKIKTGKTWAHVTIDKE